MCHPTRRTFLPAAVLGLLAAPAAAQNRPDDGLFVSVRSPITTEVVKGIRSQVEPRLNDPARPVRTVVFDFNPDGKEAANTDFGACWGLAQFIAGMKATTTTVAFVHARATGHTVLPVLTCGELVMAEGGAVGGVVGDGVPGPLDPVTALAYQQVADARRGLQAVIQKMYDKDVNLARGRSRQDATVVLYVNGANKDDAARVTNREDVGYAPPGQVVTYTARQARDVGLCKALLESRTAVAEQYGLPSIEDDVLGGRPPVAFRFTLSGEVEAATRGRVEDVLENVRRRKGNVLVLTIDCAGGDLQAAREVADALLAARTGPEPIKVIGFIPEAAPDSAAFVALGCSELVMSRRKDAPGDDPAEAVLGDFAGYIEANKNAPGVVDTHRKSLRELAERRGIPGVLVDGLFDRELVIVQAQGVKDRGRKRLMTEAEQAADRENWAPGKQIKPKGQYLKLTATLAAELGVARHAVDGRDPEAVYALYGLDPKKVGEVTPGWLDQFAKFLQLPVVTVLLAVIGFTGLILELKMPGLTAPGIIAALCFILLFWAHSSREGFVLALLLFLMGLVLVGLEIFVLPGFGAPGIFGILCMLAGLALVTTENFSADSVESWGNLAFRVVLYMFGMIGATGLAFGIARFLPNVPYANRLLLAPPDEAVGGGEVLPGAGAAAGLLGLIGTASTPLRPAGVVRLGDVFADVVSDGGFIAAGTRVQVIAVEGTRVVVKEV